MSLLDQLKDGLCAIKPMPALFDREYVKLINGPNVKTSGSKMDKAEMLTDDIRGSRSGPTPRG
jgi:myo-inositol-1-phosphate synthase